MIDPIENIIGEVEKDKLNGIKALVARQEAEQFFIDFKRTEYEDYSDKRSIGNSDRKNLAKALSGFSNSEGGVLVWGIDEKIKDSEKQLKPIKEYKHFSTLLNKEFGTLILPANTKARNIEIEDDGRNSGYVVTVIPKSNNAPHEYIKENRFYMRAGESFKPVPYSVLAGMFGKRPSPEMILTFMTNNDLEVDDNIISFSFGAMLVNQGLGVAYDIFINACILGAANMIATEIYDKNNFTGHNLNGNHTCLISNKEFRLAKEQPAQPFKFHCKINKAINTFIGIEFLIGAAGQPPRRMLVKRKKEEIRNLIDNFNRDTFIKDFLSGGKISDA